MTSLNTELALAKRFHMLSKNYSNRPVIARRNTLPTLVRFIRSNDRETRHYSLSALLLLAQHEENVELLCLERGLVPGVYAVYKDADYDDPQLREIADQILNCLEPVLQGRDPRKASQTSVTPVGSSSDAVDSDPLNDSFSPSRRARAGRVLRGVGSDAIHTVLLDIPALDPNGGDNIEAIEDIFQTTRGVLSYSIFVENRQARLFVTCATQVVQQVLSDSGFESVVVRDDVVNQEMFGGGADGSAGLNSGGNRSNTSYYDGGSPQHRPSYLQSVANSIYQSALVLGGGSRNNDTLSARVNEQRTREQEGESTFGYISKTLSKWW
ncbi:uncharacterized protein TEOVI_000368300 [Trypanosoma equiperdum]|uniref:Armadillo repeat-containing protein 1 n=2 Tax=Trypanozoon TaxID=39700 RepID=Q38A48_TRYB2|nr:hypothetical protein, conserved [Trypanosoma brucei brucei TREU927]EAN78322.1 hypothetical protein, conserved [Trypanosoma brucei brucei TREU927]SCU72107.1 hypothetical protein, conserved [Trypanosoma equiperdum]